MYYNAKIYFRQLKPILQAPQTAKKPAFFSGFP